MQASIFVPTPSQDKLGGLQQEGHPALKWGMREVGSLIGPDGVAPSPIFSVSGSDISLCSIKYRRRFLLALADLGSPEKRAVKWLCMCMCVRACVCACV